MPSAILHSTLPAASFVDTLERTYTPGSVRFVARQVETLLHSRATSIYHQQRISANGCFAHLNRLLTMSGDWSSYGSPCPEQSTIEAARRITFWFISNGLVPDKVRPSAEGGVALAFIGSGKKRALTEILNNGEHFIMLYDLNGRVETIEWEKSLPSVADIVRLSEHLRG